MTRETRIGLLVGLLFIIGFAVVLSQLTKETTVPIGTGNGAPIAATSNGNTAETATSSDVRAIAFTPVLETERHVAPPTVAVESTRLDPAATPEVKTDMLAGATPAGNVETTVLRTEAAKPATPAAKAPVAEVASADKGGTIDLTDLASKFNTEVIKDKAPAADKAPASLASARTYEVKAGDTLYKIAKAVYGNSSKHALILEANKDKLPSATSLKIGQKLVIPALPESTPAVREEASHPTTQPAARNNARGLAASPERDVIPMLSAAGLTKDAAKDASAQPTTSRRVYVVRSGDNLYKIAKSSNTTVDKIVKANNLKNPKALKVGDKLEIPG